MQTRFTKLILPAVLAILGTFIETAHAGPVTASAVGHLQTPKLANHVTAKKAQLPPLSSAHLKLYRTLPDLLKPVFLERFRTTTPSTSAAASTNAAASTSAAANNNRNLQVPVLASHIIEPQAKVPPMSAEHLKLYEAIPQQLKPAFLERFGSNPNNFQPFSVRVQ